MPGTGTLYLCPTPIGNLEDITLRVVRVLKEVDLIAAESTTHTKKLLHAYDIRKPLISYYDLGHPEAKERKLLQTLLEGKSVALVPSAGTPLVSDPGYSLVRKCLAENIPVVSLPGPSAFVTALCASGLPPHPLYFGGFLPAKKKARRDGLRDVSTLPCTLIFYEAPHRIAECLEDCLEVLGDRVAVLARELSKIHEELIRGFLSELTRAVSSHPVKGEITLLIHGAIPSAPKEDVLEGEIRLLLEKGVSISEASRQLAAKHDISKNKIYALAHRLLR